MAMQTDSIQRTLDDAIRRIVDEFHPQRIVLFGSHACGSAGPDSDIDLLIVMDVEGSTRRKANQIDLLLADRTVPIDFLVLTPEQYERQRRTTGTIIREADRLGKVLYDHAA